MIGSSRDSETTEIKEFLTSLIGNAPIGIMAFDMDNRCTLANGWAGDVFDAIPEQLVDCHLDQLLENWPELKSCIPVSQLGGRIDFDLHAIVRHHQVYDINCRMIVNGLLITLHDITEETRIREEQTLLVSRLEKANGELAEFAYICAHDMKSPVSNLMGLMEHVSHCGGLTNDALSMFELMKQSIEGLDIKIRSLNSILALKKTLNEDGGQSSLPLVLEQVMTSLQHELSSIDVTVDINVFDDSRLAISDPHLHSVLYNLISNAVKYRHKDRRSVITINAEQTGNDMTIAVVDNGIGFDQKRCEDKLFGLFNRLHTHVEGTGVGLYLVKSIVESYGGRVSVDSLENAGTTFRLELPHAA